MLRLKNVYLVEFTVFISQSPVLLDMAPSTLTLGSCVLRCAEIAILLGTQALLVDELMPDLAVQVTIAHAKARVIFAVHE